VIFRPLERGDGFRHGAIGAPGYGKTHHVRRVVAAAIDRALVDLVLTHDTKSARPDFTGTILRTPGELAARAGDLEATRHAVFRGDPLHQDEPLSPEVVAAGGRRLLRGGVRVLLNVGELDQALTEGGRSWAAPTVRWWSSQGRVLQGSLTWTTQQPKRAPDEIFDQSTSIAFFHLDARSANYLANTLMLDDRLVAELPRLDVGSYLLWEPGAEWSGRTYRDPP
jgi:hypothetical protein